MKDQINDIINNTINPALAAHRGGCELIDVIDGKASIRLVGSCTHCPGKRHTFNKQVIPYLKEKVEGLQEVTIVD